MNFSLWPQTTELKAHTRINTYSSYWYTGKMTCSIDKNFSLVSITDAKGAHTYIQTDNTNFTHLHFFYISKI